MIGVFGEFNQAWIRAFIILIFLVPFGILTKQYTKIKKSDWKWFITIGMLGGLNQAPYFFGFHYLNVGTATLLFFTALTMGAYAIGKIFFNEKLTSTKYFSLILAVIGLATMYSFSLSVDQILPAISTSVAGLMGAGVVVLSKKVSDRYSETQILTSFFIVMLFANLVLSFVFHETTPMPEFSISWIAQLGYCVSIVLANAAVVKGFKYLEPSIGGLVGLLEVIFGVAFGILFFGEVVTMSTIIGGGLILLAASLPDVKKLYSKLKDATLVL